MGDEVRTRLARARVDTAVRQFGLLTSAQLHVTGLSRQTIAKQVRATRLEPFLPGVFAMPGHPDSFQRDLMGGILYAGQGSAVSGRSAAWAWQLDGFGPTIVEISSVGRKKPPPRMPSGRRLLIHRVDRHLLPEIVTAAGLPATSVRKTLLDLAGRKHPRVGTTLDHALRRGLASLGDMWLLYEEEWIRGRRGVAILRELLRARTPGEAPSHGDLEDLFRAIVRKFDLPKPQAQFPQQLDSTEVHVDFAYPREHLAIECDGFAWHADRVAFERDRERDIALQGRGWTVLRFMWAKLKYEPEYVASQVRLHLERASAHRV